MSMTKKDYELIAEAIFLTHSTIRSDTELLKQIEGITRTAEYIAHNLAQDNPKFKVHKFLQACGIEQDN